MQEKFKKELLSSNIDQYKEIVNAAANLQKKYEILAKEYNAQVKNIQEKHVEITKKELDNRENIKANFEKHLEQIKGQIK